MSCICKHCHITFEEMLDHEKPQAVYPQVYEITRSQGQDSPDDGRGNLGRISSDIEATSTLVEEMRDPTPPGARGEHLRSVVDSLPLIRN